MRRLSAAVLIAFCILAPSKGMQVYGTQPAVETSTVGVAAIDITPGYPVRLSGFGNRREESDGVTQRIWAKALAIGSDQPVVLIAVDNCGVSAQVTEEVAARLKRHAGIPRDRVAITSTHTHTAPMLRGVLPNLFGRPIPPEHQDRIDRYTLELTDKLEQVAVAALADRKPATLAWGIGKVAFAINRRSPNLPVDHDLPLLVVRDLKAQVRAIYVSYATHCVTLRDDKISGDWAGYAQEEIQRNNPGAIALVSVGCGAESNPKARTTGYSVESAGAEGAEIAAEVQRLLAGHLTPLNGEPQTQFTHVDLPLAALPTRAEWDKLAERTDAIGYNARVQLGRLSRGEPLRTAIHLPVQTWTFGDRMAMVFLGGEVVQDYSLRLKRELDGLRLWVNGYANDVPCYIPSERVLKLGAYEGRGAMVYYDVPGPFEAGLEQKIVDAVRQQLGKRFDSPIDPKRTQGSLPLSPQQAVAVLQTHADLTVDLVVAEPLIADPVAIDFGPDGRLWVAEMHDYPAGQRGDFQPGGRVRLVEDADGDGRYDRATVFLDQIPFPTGVTVWKKGILVCAAPDILYAEDTDGDRKADVVRKLFSGFGTQNYQARVNSLRYGLDNWVYGSCGLFGGRIASFTGAEPVNLGDRDFRIRPDEGILEPATGRTQQSRVRDDWDNWFGCTNGSFCRHYPLADHYLRRNPHMATSDTTVSVPIDAEANRVYPARADLQLFKLSGKDNQATSACGLGIYRDNLLGEEYRGDAFTCEPVNLVVHRLRLEPRQSTFAGRRSATEPQSEFLASTDNWFRPVQALTGPDGGLWVVDMCRYVIEHPKFIPAEDLAKIDVRAGETLGRIYRVRPKHSEPRSITRLDRLDTAGLVAALDSPNGWQRDLAGQMLLWNADKSAATPLRTMLNGSSRAEARLHALCVLDGLRQLKVADVRSALADPRAGVRRHAVRLAEQFLATDSELGAALIALQTDTDAQVRLQIVYTLGEWRDPRAGTALAALALRHANDPHLTAAVLSSANQQNVGAVLAGVFADDSSPPPERLVEPLLGVATAIGDRDGLRPALRKVTSSRDGQFAPWQMAGLVGMLEAIERRQQSWDKLVEPDVVQRIGEMLSQARTIAADEQVSDARRIAALRLAGRDRSKLEGNLELLGRLLAPQNSAALQSAAVDALGRISDLRAAAVLISGWKGYSPALKSQALDLLLSRSAWQRRLLEGIEQQQLTAADLDPTRRQRLLRHRDPEIRNLATKLFNGATSPDRGQVLESHRDVLSLSGDRARGKDVFARRCAACHRFEEVGFNVGPNLAALTTRSPQYLLIEILDPNRTVDGRYTEYTAVTRAGQLFTGILSAESAGSITLQGQENKLHTLLRSELDELVSTGRSIMPEGLEKDLSRQDLADLIAYVIGDARLVPGHSDSLPSRER